MNQNEALEKLKQLLKPGQELYHSECIEVMAECYEIVIIMLENKLDHS